MVIVTQITPPEFQELIDSSIERSLKKLMLKNPIESILDGEDILTIDQAASFLGLVKPTLYSKVSRKELPYMKKGKRIYFSKSELIEYLKSGKQMTLKEINEEADKYISKMKH